MKLRTLQKVAMNSESQTAVLEQASLTASLASVDGEIITSQDELLPLTTDNSNNSLQVRNEEEITSITSITNQNKIHISDSDFSGVCVDDGEDYATVFAGGAIGDTQIENDVYSALFSENTGNSGNSGNSLVYETAESGNTSGNPLVFITTDDRQITINVLPGCYDPTYGKPALPKELWCYGLEWAQAEPLHAHYKQRYFAALSIQDGKYCIEGKL